MVTCPVRRDLEKEDAIVLNLVFLGIQGSGKGTQAGLLKTKHGFEHLNMGALLRQNMAQKTQIGLQIAKYMLAGELVPDNFIFTLIEKNLHPEARGIVFDGFPRTLNQAEFMEERIPVNYAVFFDLDDETAIKRLTARRVCQECKRDYNLLIKPPKDDNYCDQCGGKLVQRNDDYKEAIIRRINIFHEQTRPLIDFFTKRNKLIHIDALDKPDIIHQKLISGIKLKL